MILEQTSQQQFSYRQKDKLKIGQKIDEQNKRLYSFLSLYFCVLLGLIGCGSSVDDVDDPVVDNTPVLFVERSNLIESEDDNGPVFFQKNNLEPGNFFPGARLMLRKNTSIGASSEHLFATKLCNRLALDSALFLSFCEENRQVKLYDVKDLAVSHDGQVVVFAVRAPMPENNNDPEPTWDLWKYSFATDVLEPVFVSAAVAAIGDDVAPAFLPDGDLIFSSSLQQRTRALLLDEGKSQFQGLEESREVPALSLHRIDANGTTITQLTFNMSHDLDPAVLPNGRVLFSRWDHMGSVNRVNLYTIKPDGSDLQIYYGAHSHERSTGNNQLEYFKPKPSSGTDQIFVQYTEREPTLFETGFLFIDGQNYIDNTTPVYANTGGVGPAQTVPRGFEPDEGGSKFAFASPLNDGTGRVLSVWSPCRLVHEETGAFFPCSAANLANPTLTQAPPLYGLWMFDTNTGTQTLVQQGTTTSIATEAVIVASRTREPILGPVSSTSDYNAAAAAENLAQVHIRSVYDIAGVDTSSAGMSVLADPLQTPPNTRPIMYMRILKGVRIPDDDVKRIENADYGISRQQLMRELIGYVPVEPDGSVTALVPAQVPLAFSFLNAAGERVNPRHQNWLHFNPGEVYECRSCHENSTDQTPHGRLEAQPPSANIGATANIAFPNTLSTLAANVGESMAQVWARINAPHRPTVDLEWEDVWTDPALATPGIAVAISHDDLTTAKPLTAACIGNDGNVAWTPLCRVPINYPTHIEPLWSVAREGLDSDGVTLQNQTCIACHTRRDDLNQLIVPAGQLELSANASPEQARHSISYRELFANDAQVELRDGALQDVLVQVIENGEPVPVLDVDGEPVLDINGDPVFELTTVNVTRTMSPAGARSSQRFFNVMTTDTQGTVDHRGFLSEAELLLLRQWLDMGAQYYNDPFATP